MSMFHELMMRKKEQIMYATIKGTLTENDGVFSGFGGENYLQIQNIINIGVKDFVIATKIKANSINNTRIIANFGTNYSGIHISSNKIAGSFYINGTRVQINNDITFTTNTDYYVIMYRKGTTIGISVSTDTVNWTTNEQTIQSTDEVNFGFNNLDIGVNRYGATYFNGSIDLNNSYIKIGATKYNLQAVVGYTIVGSPTITDGVLINPTDKQNTIKIATNYEGTINKFEMMMKVLPTKVDIGLFRFNSSSNSRATIRSTGQARLYPNYPASSTDRLDTTQTLWNSAVSDNVPLYVRVIYEVINNEYKYYCDFSFDKITWVKNETTLSVPLANTLIEFFSSYASYATGVLSGCNLYLNETYIKINNKLWFNGQPS